MINKIYKYYNLLGMKVCLLFKPITTFFYPSFIAIEPTVHCNLNCVMCQRNTLSRTNLDLKFSLFKKIIDSIPSLRVIDLQGFGEPFMCKDFFKMVDYANDKGVKVYTFSNGNLITKEMAEKIVNSNLKEIIISMDGATKKTYEKIRKGADFNKLITNLKYLFKVRNPKRTSIKAWITPTTLNFKELEDIIKLCIDLGFDEVNIQSKLTIYSYKKFSKSIKDLSLNDSYKFKQKLDELKVKYPIKICSEKTFSNESKCTWAWTSLFISTDGDVVPCCVVADPKVVSFGNILKQDFKDIWNGKKYKEFRNDIKINKIPFYCKDCYK